MGGVEIYRVRIPETGGRINVEPQYLAFFASLGPGILWVLGKGVGTQGNVNFRYKFVAGKPIYPFQEGRSGIGVPVHPDGAVGLDVELLFFEFYRPTKGAEGGPRDLRPFLPELGPIKLKAEVRRAPEFGENGPQRGRFIAAGVLSR